jgi:hypothetical protein
LSGWLILLENIDLRNYLANAPDTKTFLAPNSSDQELVTRAKERLAENGIHHDRIEISYDVQQLRTGDIYISYDPPDLVVRVVYEKKPNGMVKMKSIATIKL